MYIHPSEMVLSSQGRMRSCATLSDQPDIKLKIAIQVPKAHLFLVLKTSGQQVKVKYKVRQCVHNI